MSNFVNFVNTSSGVANGGAPNSFSANTADTLAEITASGYLTDLETKINEYDTLTILTEYDTSPALIYGYAVYSGDNLNFVPNSSGNEVTSVFGRTGAVVAAADDYTAEQVTNVPAGSIAATNVQDAIDELDTSKISSGTGAIVNADVNASAAIALTKLAAATASRALVSSAGGVITAATTTATEIGYVNGVTSAIQTQLNSKLASTSLLIPYAVGSGTYGGGSTSTTISVSGMVSTDSIAVQLTASTNAVSILKADAGSGSITVTFSADPGAATAMDYQAWHTV